MQTDTAFRSGRHYALAFSGGCVREGNFGGPMPRPSKAIPVSPGLRPLSQLPSPVDFLADALTPVN